MSEIEAVNYNELYEIGKKLINYSSFIKESLNKIDNYMKCLEDNTIWNGESKKAIIHKYFAEREQLNLLYLQLVQYSKTILETVLVSEDLSIKASKILENLNETLLWQS